MSDLFNPDETKKDVIPVALPLTPDDAVKASDPVQLFAEVLELFDDHGKWKNAPLSKIKIISNTKVGSVGQHFIEKLCGQLKIPIEFPMNAKGVRQTQSPWDVRIAGIEFELKTATEDVGPTFYGGQLKNQFKFSELFFGFERLRSQPRKFAPSACCAGEEEVSGVSLMP